MAIVDVEGTTHAFIGNASVGMESGVTVANVQVTAFSKTDADSETLAVSAGIIAASGSVAMAEVHPGISAFIGGGAEIEVSGDVAVQSLSLTDADADALGINVAGGAALGVSIAEAIVTPTISTSIGSNSRIVAGGHVTVRSLQNSDFGGGPIPGYGATAEATCGSGGILVGVGGADVEAESSPLIDTSVQPGAAITAAGDVSLVSRANNTAVADGLSVAVGGAVGVGVTLADATAGGLCRSQRRRPAGQRQRYGGECHHFTHPPDLCGNNRRHNGGR